MPDIKMNTVRTSDVIRICCDVANDVLILMMLLRISYKIHMYINVHLNVT